MDPATRGQHRLAKTAPTIPTRAVRWNAWCLVLANAGTGISYLVVAVSGRQLGASAPTLRLVQAVCPLWVWALALLTAAVCVAARCYIPGHTIAVVVWAYWTGCALTTVLTGTTTGAGGVWILLQLVLQHLIALSWRLEAARAPRT